jgi:hypothetical protein
MDAAMQVAAFFYGTLKGSIRAQSIQQLKYYFGKLGKGSVGRPL